MNDTSNSELNNLIPAEIKNDDFYAVLQKIAKEENIKTILEIGSSSGEGSTEAIVTGLKQNPNKPTLFCIEVSQTRFAELSKRYAHDSCVKCYNVSSVSLQQFPSESEVITFYNTNRTNLNYYPIDRVLGWLRQDIKYVKSSGVADNGITKIKQENHIDIFDFVLIDGSEFTGSAELTALYGAKIICLDDINAFKNYQNHQKLLVDTNYKLVTHNYHIRNGYSIFKRVTENQNTSFTSKAEISVAAFLEMMNSPNSYHAIQDKVEAVEGFMVSGQEEYLFNKVKLLPNDAVIVEIGSFKGRSTVAMGYACIGTNRKIYCIDTWDGNDSDFSERNFLEVWQHNVQNNQLSQYVVPLQGYSYEILTSWNELTNGKPIDFIFIDGSHQYLDVLKDFELSFPLVKDGGWIAFHDVVNTWPGPELLWHHIAKHYLVNHEYSSTLACGQKVLNTIPSVLKAELSIHFLTIVINGEPFIRYHIEVFKQLPFEWHWHIVEGVAELKHDTAWSLQLGGRITDELHHNGRSCDGTTEYLNELAKQYPENITIYRKPEGVFWDGKREMVNAPLSNINKECLLWQIDADELWTVEQICTVRQMFINNPDKTAAFYWCWYFVGKDLIISTRNCYAQNPQQEWLRTWRYKPGSVWVAHEPPRLAEPLSNGEWRDIAAVNPFTHKETEKQGLIFQHFAYVTPEQLHFKEQYYGYKNAVNQWNQLQEQPNFPVLLREYFSWVQDTTQVDKASAYDVIPLAQRQDGSKDWRFLQLEELYRQSVHIKKPCPIIIVDGVFFQLYKTGIARVWKSLLEEWVNKGFAKHLVVLDRVGTAPAIAGIKYRSVPAYDYANTDADRQMLQQICDEQEADLFISSYYTTPLSTPSVFLAHDMIPELMGADLNNPMWREKHYGIQHASAYIAVSENTARDLVRFFPDIALESVTIAQNGVDHKIFSPAGLEDINRFKTKYGISKPYFLLVGASSGYKNTILFFKAFGQLYSSQGFDIVCTGRGALSLLETDFRNYTSGSTVQMLQLGDEELSIAYSGAVALVYPSKYEGFGLPVLEAIACGCPVITCPNGAIPEVAKEAALYINDENIDGLTNALCDVQKPDIRNLLVAAGLEQAKKFSWSKMAETVSSALIDATLQPLNLREINLIIFPDWSQTEELLCCELEQVIKAIATRADSNLITLLVDNSNIPAEEANLVLSGVAMNLLMQEDLDITEGLEISLVGHLSEIQWKALFPRIRSRIVLENENSDAIAQVRAEIIPSYDQGSFISSSRG